MLRDLESKLLPTSSLRASAAAAAANGSGVDLRGFDAALAVLDVVALGGTSPTATFKLQESDDDSTYTDVATADMTGGAQPSAFSAAGVAIRSYIGGKRYLRWRLDALTGTSPTATASGTIARGASHREPV